ncbi:MAG: hypothetical protein V4792_16520 [Pseudomonadota bacterium]
MKQASQVVALVLVDIPSHQLKAGEIVEADADTVQALGASIDAHKAAVSYARKSGANVVSLKVGGK